MIAFENYPLVETEWLAAHLDEPDIRIVDARWRGDGSGYQLYQAEHIPNAVHIDYKLDISHTAKGIDYMLVPPAQFSAAMEKVGIGNETLVIAYAERNHSGAARLWWALHYFGHSKVALLNGGLTKWIAESRPLSTQSVRPMPTQFTPNVQPKWLANAADIKVEIENPESQVCLVDTRPLEQFEGKAIWTPEGNLYLPPGQDWVEFEGRKIRGGRLQGAIHLHATYNQDQTSWCYLEPAALHERFESAGVPKDKRVIAYCGVGISASNALFALYLAGYRDLALYDGSWSEWGLISADQ